MIFGGVNAAPLARCAAEVSYLPPANDSAWEISLSREDNEHCSSLCARGGCNTSRAAVAGAAAPACAVSHASSPARAPRVPAS